MQILIIEDERPAAAQLKRISAKLKPDAVFHGPLESISASVKWLISHPAPDLILCDIQLSDGLSFEIFEQVTISSPIIFTTAYDQFAIRAFKLNSIDYLLKPVDPGELQKALQKFEHRKQSAVDPEILRSLLQKPSENYKFRFMIKLGDTIKSIQTDEIVWIVSENKATLLHTKQNKNHIIDYTLNDLERLLDPQKFFRLNRRYLASIDAIKQVLIYSNSRLKIDLYDCNDEEILISRNRVQLFKEWLDGRETLE